jgi:hypothetical protein
MTCRWTLNLGGRAEAAANAVDGLALYLELAREGREDEFRWFARSQGVPEERVDGLWRAILVRLGSGPQPTV